MPLHELEREEREHDAATMMSKDGHLSRLVPSLFCANMTMPTQSARMIAILMILSTQPDQQDADDHGDDEADHCAPSFTGPAVAVHCGR